MNIFSPSQLAFRLSERAEAVCKELLPNGKRRYGRWECGSVMGEEGVSLKVELSGDRRGVWGDFATGDGGDLLDLWSKVRGISIAMAMREVASFLNLHLDGETSMPRRAFRSPEKPSCRSALKHDAMHAWLQSRGLTDETVQRYGLAVNDRGELILPYIKKGAFVNAKYRTLPKTFRQEQGACPTLFGWQVLESLYPNTRSVVITEGECFQGDAEVLTPTGWVRLADYQGGPVAQWDQGVLAFVEPLAIIRKPFDGDLIEYAGPQFYSLTTPGHKMVSLDRQGHTYVHTAQEGPKSGTHRIPRCGVMDGPGIPLTDAQIALCVAISVNATLDVRNNGGRYVHFWLKEQGRMTRLEALTNTCGLMIANHAIGSDARAISFMIPDWVPGRLLPWEWIGQATRDQREFILNELNEWDDNRVQNRNWNDFIKNAEWVQALAHTTGRCATILDRGNKKGSKFHVRIFNQNVTSTWKAIREDRIHYQGEVYCVQVPSGAIMVRQQGIVSISGNCDAMTFTQYGFPALSVPMGGGGGNKQSWIDEDFDDLMQFDTIYIATDMDEAGDRAADEITRRLGSERCRRVKLPYKDANECLMKGVPVDVIRDAIRTAKTNDPDELKRAGYFTDDVMDVFAGNGLGATGVRCPWGRDEFRLRPSELTIVSGYSGSGKSTLLAQLAIDGMTQGTRWCKASMEMPARVILAGMVQTITQTLTPSPEQVKHVMKWLDERLWMFDVRGTAQADRMMTVFEYAAKRYAIQYYTIDSLAKCGMAEDDYNGQKLFTERLTDFNHTYGASSLLVAHSRKQESETVRPRKHDVRGATAITDMADNVMIIWRDKSENSDNKAEIIIDKQRLTGWEGTLQLHYDPSCRQFLYGQDGPKDYMRLLS